MAQKLGIKPNTKVVMINAPPHYPKLLDTLPEGVRLITRAGANPAFIHLFTKRRTDLEKRLKQLRRKMADTGTLWVSWPKKSSGVATDITEDTIRDIALPLGLVDVKVCAVDETWSGLKLMIRRENRK